MELGKKIFGLFTSFGLGFFVYKTIKVYLIRYKYRHVPGPKTNGIYGFYLGNLDEALRVLNEGKIFSDLMNEWVQVYGKVFKFQILDKIVVFTVDTQVVKEVLVEQNFPKIPEVYQNVAFPFNERFLGYGLITETDNGRWKHRRAMHNPGFHRICLASYMKEFNSKSDILLEKLRADAENNKVVTIFNEMNHVLLDIIANIAIGMNVDSVNDPDNVLNKYVYESLKGFYRTTFDPFIHYKPSEWGFIKRYKSILKKLRDLGKNEIFSRFKLLSEGGYFSGDILTNLIENSNEKVINVEEMIDDILTFFVAGQETTANTLAFCFLEIARNPDVLKKLRDEIDEAIGSRTEITFDDLSKLKYTSCVYKETLRLWPPIPEIARQVNREYNANGIRLPVDTWVQVSSYVSGRQKSYFENPNKFQPERFLQDSDQSPIQNYTYFPFSLGPRNCLGQNFAQMVGKVLIAKIVKNFDITLDASQNFGIKQEATLRPADGTRCYFKIRKSI